MTPRGYGVSFWDAENVLFLDLKGRLEYVKFVNIYQTVHLTCILFLYLHLVQQKNLCNVPTPYTYSYQLNEFLI